MMPTSGGMVLRPAPETATAHRRRASRPRRLGVWGRLVVAAVAAVALFGFAGNPISATGADTPPAAAIPGLPDGCGDPSKPGSPPGPERWPGPVNLPGLAGVPGGTVIDPGNANVGLAQNSIFSPTFGSGTPTAYEWWGTAGLTWSGFAYENLGYRCNLLEAVTGKTGLSIANIAFGLVVTIGTVGLWVFSFLMGANVFDMFITPIANAVTALNQGLYVNYLAPILILSTLWMAWKGLVKKQSREAVQAAFWMIGATTAAAIFFANPAGLMKGFNTITQTVTDSIISAAATIGVSASGATEMEGRSDARELADSRKAGFGAGDTGGLCSATGRDASVRISQCVMWYTFMYQPWAAGQFGGAAAQKMDPVTIKNGDAEATATVSKPGPGQTGEVPVPLMFLDSSVINQGEVRAANPLFDAEGGAGSWASEQSGGPYRQARYQGVLAHMMCSDDPGDVAKTELYKDGILTEEGRECAAVAGHAAFSGSDANTKLSTAIVALVAVVVGMLPLVFLAGSLIVLQVGGVLLYLVAPIFLLLGVHPGFGRRMAMGWMEMLLANSLKRIGTAFLISALLILIGAITGTPGGWFTQVLLIAAASIAVLAFRKQFLQKISRIGLGGDGGGGLENIGQEWQRKGKKAASRGVGGGAAAAGATVAGGGAKEALFAGAAGAMMGRAATPLIAARIGWGAGQRKGKSASGEAGKGAQPGWEQGAGQGAAGQPVGADMPRPQVEGQGEGSAVDSGPAARTREDVDEKFQPWEDEVFSRQAELAEAQAAAGAGSGREGYGADAYAADTADRGVSIDDLDADPALLDNYRQGVRNKIIHGNGVQGATRVHIPDPELVGNRIASQFALAASQAAQELRADGGGDWTENIEYILGDDQNGSILAPHEMQQAWELAQEPRAGMGAGGGNVWGADADAAPYVDPGATVGYGGSGGARAGMGAGGPSGAPPVDVPTPTSSGAASANMPTGGLPGESWEGTEAQTQWEAEHQELMDNTPKRKAGGQGAQGLGVRNIVDVGTQSFLDKAKKLW